MSRNIAFIAILKSFVFAAFILGISANIFGQAIKPEKPTVMILGTYHMGNPGLDLNNIKADDVLAEKRQKEINDFIALIKKFKPTRIAVEEPVDNAKLNERYAKYLRGEYQLTRNETDQIGFRLAKELNHRKIYTIDWQGNFDFNRVMASAKANNQMPSAEKAMSFWKNSADAFGELQKTGTVTDLLKFMNDEKRADETHRSNLIIARVGAGQDFAGADLARDWYERNLKIYANITRITESNDDRVLVLIGAGHLKLLQQFALESGEYDLEKLGKYL
jgi:hypothetical protein